MRTGIMIIRKAKIITTIVIIILLLLILIGLLILMIIMIVIIMIVIVIVVVVVVAPFRGRHFVGDACISRSLVAILRRALLCRVLVLLRFVLLLILQDLGLMVWGLATAGGRSSHESGKRGNTIMCLIVRIRDPIPRIPI